MRSFRVAAAVTVAALVGCASSPAFAGGAEAPEPSGGTLYGTTAAAAPVVRTFSVAPARVVSGAALPRVALRIDRPGRRSVRARVVLWPVRSSGAKLVRIDLGRLQTGRRVQLRWPRGTVLAPGRYTVRVHVAGVKLVRSASATGRARLTVAAPPPPPPLPPAPIGQVVEGGVFPVQGPHTYGDGIGADRGDHRHEGQDISAAEGTPIVAPVAGSILAVDFQERGAGHYVVLRADDGRDMFFAHCRAGSVAVTRGARVAQGGPLCEVGSTGRSSGPHLHFEIWPAGWKKGEPADPLPQLLAWDPSA